MKKLRPLTNEENGFASLVVAFIFIIIMALVTVGFAQVARREQQNALNSQLSTQAYYAAESGVNDIKNNLPTIMTDSQSVPDPAANNYYNGTYCLNQVDSPENKLFPNSASTLNNSDDVVYTCPTVNLTPPNEVISSSSSTGAANFLFSLEPSSPGPPPALSTLYFYWGSNATPNPNNNPVGPSEFCGDPSGSCFPQLSTWLSRGHAPVVQLSLTPIYAPPNITRNNLINDTFTVMLYPSNGAIDDPGSNPNPPLYSCSSLFNPGQLYGAVNYENEDIIANVNPCNDVIVGANYAPGAAGTTAAEYPYSVSINRLPLGVSQWLVHYNWAYGPINACLAANSDLGCVSSTSATTDFYGGEVDVDVTGKDKDVVKRIDEVLPATTSTSGITTTQNGIQVLPWYPIQSWATCKQFQTNPATDVVPGGANTQANSSPPSPPYNSSPFCTFQGDL